MFLLVSLFNTTGTDTTDAARSVVNLAANPPPLLRQTSHPSDCVATREHGGRYFDTTVEEKGVTLDSCKCDRADSMWLWNTSCVLVGVSRTSPSLLKLSR